MVILGDEPKACRAMHDAATAVKNSRRIQLMEPARINARSFFEAALCLWRRHPLITSVVAAWSFFWILACAGALYAALRGWMIS